MDAPSPGTRSRCPVCKSPYKAQYHALKAAGEHMIVLESESRKLGRAIKRETFGKHFRICLGGRDPLDDLTLASDVEKSVGVAKTSAEIDFAQLVRKRAADLLQAGALRVTASHGLQAQALLDRRAEKQADRELAVNLARLMSGAISITPTDVIEGRVVDVTPLAPAELVEPRA